MEFASAQTRDKACPSPMGAAVGCDALCASPAEAASLSADCYARREVYKIDTHVRTVPLGTLVFGAGDLVFDASPLALAARNGSQHSSSGGRQWLLEIRSFAAPARHLRFRRDAREPNPRNAMSVCPLRRAGFPRT